MQKNGKLKRIFMFLIALVMFSSPVLLAGCSLFDFYPSNNNDSSQTHSGNGNNGGNTSGGSGSGGSGGSGSSSEAQPTTTIYDPPTKNRILLDEYDEYFKNYRITYKPGEVDRKSFDDEIVAQNQNIARLVLNGLYDEYGIKQYQAHPKLHNDIDNIQIENKYLAYANQDNEFFLIRLNDNNIKKPFTHANAINNDSLNNDETYNYWLWNTNTKDDNNTVTLTNVSKEEFENAEFKAKLELAELLILSGETINEDGSGTFAYAYKTYFVDNDTKKSLSSNYFENDKLKADALDDVISKINHLGYTEHDQSQLKNFVLNYIIGTNLVNADNHRFVNCYYDGSHIQIVNDSNYKRFLTDETYATGRIIGDTIGFSTSDSDDGSLLGLMYYASQYLISTQNPNYQFDVYTSTNPFIANENNTTTTSISYSNYNFDSNVKDIYDAIYNNLINVAGTKVKLDEFGNAEKDENDNIIYEFNSNVWGYDANGNVNSLDATDTVEYSVGTGSNKKTYSLFSVRLPYFKNYYNTVSFMIRDMFQDEPSAQTRAEWENEHGFEYPYDSNFPNVPLSYFSDFNSDEMLMDDNLNIIMKDAGYQSYQSFLIMPSQDIYLKDATIWFDASSGYESEESNLEITLYARYYDKESKSYAVWENDDGYTEFYKIGTVNVPFINEYGDCEYLDIDLREILGNAIINGEQKANYLLNEFNTPTETVDKKTLISKENYGYWFDYGTTPEGKEIVCFNGKLANSSSYLEIVFYTESDAPFMFSFCPETSYKV